ncbi:MAG: DUF861 domain-containing protein [Ramlibacter sp.]|nr:DUF861 domain-containing protein [Ramlibacter sp.]
MTHTSVNPANLQRDDLQPAPIGAEWVIHGQPQARAVEVARSPDGTCLAAHWDCTAGTFYWYFNVEETIHILEGEVLVRDDKGREARLGPGDVAVMPANKWMVWQVDEYVRKLAICRSPLPWPFGGVFRRLQDLRNRFNVRRRPAIAPAT